MKNVTFASFQDELQRKPLGHIALVLYKAIVSITLSYLDNIRLLYKNIFKRSFY